ncbi:MAG: class I SAM-dependent methyltransferase [Proteobacteria bacterium]|nr:class I SAM-dependent methyltransferase [Pseudomonadota bacterium]
MITGLWIFFSIAGCLFILKMVYALSVAVSIPVTAGALYVSTSHVRVMSFLNEVKMAPGQLFIDIGCGDGRALRKACRLYNVRGIGYEVNPLAFLKAKCLSLGHKNIRIFFKNFFKDKLSDADVIFCYLFPDVMKQVSKKLKSELKPGTVIGSCNFELPGFVPEKVLRPGNSLHNDPIYIYRM